MDFPRLAFEKRFLGAEFLTWLLFDLSQESIIQLKDGRSVEIYFEDKIILDSPQVDCKEAILKGENPSESGEAKMALGSGKKVKEAKLRFIIDGREWIFSVKADEFIISGLRIPAVLTSQTDDRFFDRMDLIETIYQVFIEVYSRFLDKRLTDTWEKDEIKKIRKWVKESG